MKYLQYYESLKSKKSIKVGLLRDGIAKLNKMFEPLGIIFKHRRKFVGIHRDDYCDVNYDLNNLYYIHALLQCIYDRKQLDTSFNIINTSKAVTIALNYEDNPIDMILNFLLKYFEQIDRTIHIKEIGFNAPFEFAKDAVMEYIKRMIENPGNDFENKEFILNLIMDYIIRQPNSYELVNLIKKGRNMNALYNSLSVLHSEELEKGSELGEMGFSDD